VNEWLRSLRFWSLNRQVTVFSLIVLESLMVHYSLRFILLDALDTFFLELSNFMLSRDAGLQIDAPVIWGNPRVSVDVSKCVGIYSS